MVRGELAVGQGHSGGHLLGGEHLQPGEQLQVALNKAVGVPAVSHGGVEEVVDGDPALLEGGALEKFS